MWLGKGRDPKSVGLGYAPDAPLLVHGTSGMIVAFRAALTAVLML